MSYEYEEINRAIVQQNGIDNNINRANLLQELDEVYALAEKFPEYKAKAKAFDEISKLRRKTIGRVRTVGLLAKFGVATWNVINKHERGESE